MVQNSPAIGQEVPENERDQGWWSIDLGKQAAAEVHPILGVHRVAVADGLFVAVQLGIDRTCVAVDARVCTDLGIKNLEMGVCAA